jgi:predicted amidohydrolase
LLPENDTWSNAGLYFPADGGHQIYRKINLAMNERGPLRPGDALPTFEVSLGTTPGRDATHEDSDGRDTRDSDDSEDNRSGGDDRASGDSGRFTAGIQLCREIRFPEQWQHLAAAGAELLVYLTNAANPGEPAGVWRSHLISRAAENQRFLAAANIPHPDQHCPSMMVSPRGEVLAELPMARPGLLRHTIDLAGNSAWYLGQRRQDVLSLAYHSR